tara:strand:- start:419 stop:1123 length:705 start_codon:yes stop_codon:yes gene_type:complete
LNSIIKKSASLQGRQLSKKDFIEGRHEQMIVEAGLGHLMPRNPVENRLATRDAMVDGAPAGNMIWVFGYGSLIWNPAFEFDEVRTGILHGYHRQFCFWSKIGRGSPENPGMMLALDYGGSCTGLVLGIQKDKAREELTSVFMREMIGYTYHAKWGTVKTKKGRVRAITFVANRLSENYAGRLPLEEVSKYVANGEGHLGPCADYLFNTISQLKEFGLNDPMLSKLGGLVKREMF